MGKVDLTRYLSQYKFDSLVIAEIILRTNKKFNLAIEPNILFKNPT
ncbi:acyl carrier protein [Candidatus Coxiella mudrowiae]